MRAYSKNPARLGPTGCSVWTAHTPLLPHRCDEVEVEKLVKVDSTGLDANGVALMGAKTLCLPLEQPELPPGTKCFKTGKPAKNWALWGRSY